MSWFNQSAQANLAPSAAPQPIMLDNQKYRQALASALLQSATDPTQTQKAGGYNVPTSPWESLAKLGQSAAAAYMMKGK